jgi:hypothetical protein
MEYNPAMFETSNQYLFAVIDFVAPLNPRNCRIRARQASPMGEKHRTMASNFWHLAAGFTPG